MKDHEDQRPATDKLPCARCGGRGHIVTKAPYPPMAPGEVRSLAKRPDVKLPCPDCAGKGGAA